ncbi:MAG: methyltransferase domain-containing protein [Pseudomonadota bacterium]
MLDERVVLDTFHAILGRKPESDAVLAFHRTYPSFEQLRSALLESHEFASLYAQIGGGTARGAPALSGVENGDVKTSGHADSASGDADQALIESILPRVCTVDVDAAGAERDALWDRVAAVWAKLGEDAAHWSVLTHDAFRPSNLEENRSAFVQSGELEGALVDAAMARVPDADMATMRCLEIGCGVGRATRALAQRFNSVTGVDISRPHLDIARKELDEAGHANVALHVATRIEDYAELAAGHDFLFSRLVLQHNPPPVQAAILAQVFEGMAPGAVLLFQVVTHGKGYTYRVANDGAVGKGMEMHVLPQSAVFQLMAAARIVPIEVQDDFAAGRDGPFRSHLFLGRKAGP